MAILSKLMSSSSQEGSDYYGKAGGVATEVRGRGVFCFLFLFHLSCVVSLLLLFFCVDVSLFARIFSLSLFVSLYYFAYYTFVFFCVFLADKCILRFCYNRWMLRIYHFLDTTNKQEIVVPPPSKFNTAKYGLIPSSIARATECVDFRVVYKFWCFIRYQVCPTAVRKVSTIQTVPLLAAANAYFDE